MARIILSEIQDFLLQRITTHEALRAISWLFDHADRSVATAELAEELGLPKPTAQEALDDLVDADLVCIEEAVALRYRYQTKGPELHRDLERALTFAEQDKGEVARMLSANSIHRLRGMAYVAFAPALVKSHQLQSGSGRLQIVLASLKPSRPSLRPLRQIPAPDCRNEKRVRARLTSIRGTRVCPTGAIVSAKLQDLGAVATSHPKP